MEVSLIGCTVFDQNMAQERMNDVIYSAISQCYNTNFILDEVKFIDDQRKSNLIKKVVGTGHTSVLEHVTFSFLVRNISRSCSHQLVRHRIASYTQQSQRYTKLDVDNRDWYVTPPKIHSNKNLDLAYDDLMLKLQDFYEALVHNGIPKEDARFVLPNAVTTNIVVTMNARALGDFFGKRLCNRAQWEIREMAGKMSDICKKLNPLLFTELHLGEPQCAQLGYCPEKERSCHKYKTLDEITSK